jgi:ribosome-associated protein
VHALIATLEDKKGEDILLLDIHEVSDFADYFIICSGSSDRMLESLAKSVLEKAKMEFHLSGRKEGGPGSGWLVIDLTNIVIHLFSPDQRKYYQLEELWSKGKILLRLQ